MFKRLTLSGAVVVLLALAVVTASGATFVAVGSIHTTTSDFQSGQLTNFEAQNDELRYEYTVVDNFEDGDTTVELSDWSGWTKSGTGSFFNQQNSINGTQSAFLDVSGGETVTATATTTDTLTEDFAASVQIGAQRSSGSSDIEFWGDNERLGELKFNDDSSNIEWHIGGNQYTVASGWSDSTVYRPRFDWDFANNEVTIRIAGQVDTAPIASGPDHYDELRFRTALGSGESPRNFEFDDVAIGSSQSAQYISTNHSVSNVETGFVDFSTLQTASATIEWQGWTGSGWTVVNSTTVSSPQNVTLAIAGYDKWRVNITADAGAVSGSGESIATVADEGVTFSAREPTLDNSTASPNDTRVQDREVELSINVSDADFATPQGDSITTEFFVKDPNDNSFQSVGTNTVSANGTTSLTYDATVGGQFEWYATATDSYGGTANSSLFTFETPGTLRIEDVQTGQLVNNVQVNVTFYGEDNLVVQRNTSDGTVDMTGLPADQPLTVELQADGYYNSESRLQSLFEQQTVYMLANDTDSSQIIFDVEDRTGQYPEDEALLFVERVVNGSWQTIAGGELNAIGQYRVQLENNIRHRLRIENRQGDVRQLGSYTPIAPETVTIQVGSLTIPVSTQEGVTYDAYRQNISGPSVVFEYADPYNATESLQVEIVERGNTSNVLLSNTTFDSGPYGTLKLTESLDASEQNTTWLVRFHADRGTEDDVGASILVGAQGPEWLPDLPDWMQTWISVGVTFMVGGLFSTRNAGIGGVITAIVAGIFWYIGWFSQTSGIAVGIAIAGALMITYVGDLSN